MKVVYILAMAATAWAGPLYAERLEVLPSGHIAGEVRVDGKGPYRFIVDTGASNTNLTAQLREARPDLARSKSAANLNGAGGATSVEMVRIRELQTQGRTFSDLEAFVLPRGPMDELKVDGVLGADVISHGVLEIDVPRRHWLLADSTTRGMLKDMLPPVSFELDSARMPRLTVMVDGKPVPALLDTGAKGTFLNWAAARLLGYTEIDPRLTTSGTARGATGSQGTALRSTTASSVRIGDYQWEGAKLRIADLPIFDAIGMNKGPAMVLGIDALSSRRFVVDNKGSRLFIAADQDDRPSDQA
jgi:predicted aspartyl protease